MVEKRDNNHTKWLRYGEQKVINHFIPPPAGWVDVWLPSHVEFGSPGTPSSMWIRWIEQNIQDKWAYPTAGLICFNNEEDAVLFKLVWV